MKNLSLKVCLSPNPEKVALQSQKMAEHLQRLFSNQELQTDSRDIYIFIEDEQGHVHGGVRLTQILDYMVLESIWVDPALQNKGYGLKLYLEAERYAHKNKMQRILLNTFESLNAIPFWKRIGFEVVGKVPDCPQGDCLYYLQKKLCIE